jgi:Bacterial regulatory proteins, tetR family
MPAALPGFDLAGPNEPLTRDMARKPLRNPRKNASQKSSRATVDALIEATARILVREGFDRASTNRIAEVAGVSVGSLYQYYPGKEALVAAVIDRHNGGNHVGRPCGAAGGRLAAGRGSSAQACYRSDRGASHRP